MQRFRFTLPLSVLGAAALLFWGGCAQAADWLHVDQLGHTPVTAVAVNPSNQLEVAAVAGGSVWFSHDGGLVWRQQAFNALPTSVAFDPVRHGRVAVGTYNTCLMTSDDGGLSWTQHKVPYEYYCNVLAVTGTKAGFVFNYQQVANYTTHLYRLGGDGSLTSLDAFPSQNPGSLAYDQGVGELCAGTYQQLYCSPDNGDSWVVKAAANQIGSVVHNIVIHGGEEWLLSNSGVWQLHAGQWQQAVVHDPTQGNPYAGLVVNNGYQIFGDNADSNSVVSNSTIGLQNEGLGRHVYDLAAAGDVLFAASDDGLYATRDLTHSEAQIRRPVVVLPGITGSLPSANPAHVGRLELDPYTHTYEPLLARLRAVGYVDGQTLFPFPYNWEQPNELSARQLDAELEQVEMVCGCSKVDVVAHSMGGLVARSYIEGPMYRDDINKLIEVATPNAGSVSAYYTWEAGELYNSDGLYERAKTDILSSLFHLQAGAKGYVSFKEFIHEQVTSVQELLPIFDYIQGRSYPDGYPRNAFLEELDAPAAQALVAQRVKLRIIGGDTLDTLRQLTAGEPGPGANFPDGRVDSVLYGPGDGTVLTTSLQTLARADDFEDADHGKLPQVARDTIVRYLLEDDVDQAYLDTIVNQAELQQAVGQADQLAEVSTYHLLYAVGSGTASLATDTGQVNQSVATVPNAYYSGDDQPEHIFSVPAPQQSQYTIHFVAIGDPQSVVFGGTVIDGSSGEPAAGQSAVDLADGDSVDVTYDAVNQAVTIGKVTHSVNSGQENASDSGNGNADTQSSASDAADGPNSADLQGAQDTNEPQVNLQTGQVPVGSRSIDGELALASIPVSDQAVLLTDDQAARPNNAGVVLGASSRELLAAPASKHSGGSAFRAVIALPGNWHSLGLEFWLSVAMLIALMLAWGVWRVLKLL